MACSGCIVCFISPIYSSGSDDCRINLLQGGTWHHQANRQEWQTFLARRIAGRAVTSISTEMISLYPGFPFILRSLSERIIQCYRSGATPIRSGNLASVLLGLFYKLLKAKLFSLFLLIVPKIQRQQMSDGSIWQTGLTCGSKNRVVPSRISGEKTMGSVTSGVRQKYTTENPLIRPRVVGRERRPYQSCAIFVNALGRVAALPGRLNKRRAGAGEGRCPAA